MERSTPQQGRQPRKSQHQNGNTSIKQCSQNGLGFDYLNFEQEYPNDKVESRQHEPQKAWTRCHGLKGTSETCQNLVDQQNDTYRTRKFNKIRKLFENKIETTKRQNSESPTKRKSAGRSTQRRSVRIPYGKRPRKGKVYSPSKHTKT